MTGQDRTGQDRTGQDRTGCETAEKKIRVSQKTEWPKSSKETILLRRPKKVADKHRKHAESANKREGKFQDDKSPVSKTKDNKKNKPIYNPTKSPRGNNQLTAQADLDRPWTLVRSSTGARARSSDIPSRASIVTHDQSADISSDGIPTGVRSSREFDGDGATARASIRSADFPRGYD